MTVRVALPEPRRSTRLWLIALAVVTALSIVAAFSDYFPGDRTLAGWVQSIEVRGVDTVSDVVNALGMWPAFLIVGTAMSLACACLRRHVAAAFLLLALIASGSSYLLKLLIERPRPSEAFVTVSGDFGGFSFPSGHVLGAVLLWGFVFYAAPHVLRNRSLRIGTQAVAALVIVLTGLQRVYAGAHWPSDVVGGYLWGLLFLAIVIWAYELAERRRGSDLTPAI